MSWVTLGILAMTTLPIWGALALEVWLGAIRPRLIDQSEIDALAADLARRHGVRAAEVAFIEEDRAWRYSDSFEQGKWKRVRFHLLQNMPR
ncbi:MAG: hypothetical protein H2045_11460 [Rhizobiales bacterium]|nr:hypothetical protein [Hyphomicrobiales bacterium]